MSKVRVLKFGGKSLSSVEKINRLAKKVTEINSTNLIIIVSAMGQTTSDLLNLAKSANEETATKNANRELDMLLASGERVSAALFTLALQKFGKTAQSFTGSQAGVLTYGSHSNAYIKEVRPIRIDESLNNNVIPVIAGFQGVDPETKDVTTLGRGGSDLTACAFADYYKTSAELYKSVGHVYTCDPAVFEFAKPIEDLDYNFMQSLSTWGGQILHDKAARFAQETTTPISFYSDESFKPCTRISADSKYKTASIACLDSVIALKVCDKEIPSAVQFLNENFKETSFSILASAFNDNDSRFLVSAPEDKLDHFLKSDKIEILDKSLTAVSLVFSHQQESAFLNAIVSSIGDVQVKRLLETPKRLTFFIDHSNKNDLVSKLHTFIK